MKNLYQITVFDQELSVRTDADESQVNALAEYLQKKYEEVKTVSQNAPRTNLMALAALNAASELFEARERVEEMRRALVAKSEKLIEKIEKSHASQ